MAQWKGDHFVPRQREILREWLTPAKLPEAAKTTAAAALTMASIKPDYGAEGKWSPCNRHFELDDYEFSIHILVRVKDESWKAWEAKHRAASVRYTTAKAAKRAAREALAGLAEEFDIGDRV